MPEVNDAERQQMEKAGFNYDETGNGRVRWTHERLGLTALREDWMRERDWDRRRAEKIAEAACLRRFRDLPLGARFRFQRDADSKRLVYVKLPGIPGFAEFQIVQWTDLAGMTNEPKGLSAEDIARVVEPLEPFDHLRPSEVEQLPGLPGVWEALADWHDNQAATAEAMDFIQSSKWHDERAKLYRTRSSQILKRWEDS